MLTSNHGRGHGEDFQLHLAHRRKHVRMHGVGVREARVHLIQQAAVLLPTQVQRPGHPAFALRKGNIMLPLRSAEGCGAQVICNTQALILVLSKYAVISDL